MKYERANPVRLLRHFGGGAGGEKGVTTHAGGLVHEKRRTRLAALDSGERAGRAGIEDGNPHVGRDLIEPIAQAHVRVAILAKQQAFFVGMARVIDDDFGARGAGTGEARRVGDATRQQVEPVEQIAQLRLLEDGVVLRADAAEIDHHAREPLGVGDSVLEHRTVGASEVRADDQRVALESRVFGLDGVRGEHQQRAGEKQASRADHGVLSF